MEYKQKYTLCNEIPANCHFELRSFSTGSTVHNDDTNIDYLFYCQSGHVRITSTLFHDKILCAGEIMFVPRQSECTGTALSDVTLLVHKFNNTICCSDNVFSRIFIPIGTLMPKVIAKDIWLIARFSSGRAISSFRFSG